MELGRRRCRNGQSRISLGSIRTALALFLKLVFMNTKPSMSEFLVQREHFEWLWLYPLNMVFPFGVVFSPWVPFLVLLLLHFSFYRKGGFNNFHKNRFLVKFLFSLTNLIVYPVFTYSLFNPPLNWPLGYGLSNFVVFIFTICFWATMNREQAKNK